MHIDCLHTRVHCQGGTRVPAHCALCGLGVVCAHSPHSPSVYMMCTLWPMACRTGAFQSVWQAIHGSCRNRQELFWTCVHTWQSAGTAFNVSSDRFSQGSVTALMYSNALRVVQQGASAAGRAELESVMRWCVPADTSWYTPGAGLSIHLFQQCCFSGISIPCMGQGRV
jgi:hypothetical protein